MESQIWITVLKGITNLDNIKGITYLDNHEKITNLITIKK